MAPSTDPYAILGVSRSSTPEEIKEAYSKLAKKYHPDLNPGNKAAEQKMKEINAAYDAIKSGKLPEDGFSSYSSPFGSYNQRSYSSRSYSSRQSYADNNERDKLSSAVNYLRAGFYSQALNVLWSISRRDSRWHYYTALAYSGLNDDDSAIEYAQRALDMDPTNYDYAQLLQRLRFNNSFFFSGMDSYSSVPGIRLTPGKLFLGFLAIRFLFRIFLLLFS